MKEARDRAVNGEGASLIEAMSIRLTPHSSDDDDKYREADELQKNKKMTVWSHLSSICSRRKLSTKHGLKQWKLKLKIL
jgi:Pyruvate/2-oxoglutarate dehydrogenase complex, dehydrogenase (E1) component, eukaryotic type, alpha subunit